MLEDLAQRRSSLSCAVPFVIISRRNISYNKLPQKPLNLTILKLDHSSFEIQVPKTATVAELRNSVENAFSHLPKQRSGKVLWSHVWGHFCLCFDGQKLLDDNEYIADYDIRNRSAEQISDIEQPSISNTWEQEEETDDGVYESCNDKTHRQDDEDKFSVITHEYKLATMLRGWFSYHRVSLGPEPNFEPKSFSRSSSSLLGSFKNVILD